MQKMVKYMKDKGIFEGYIQAYGVPDIPDAPEAHGPLEDAPIVSLVPRILWLALQSS